MYGRWITSQKCFDCVPTPTNPSVFTSSHCFFLVGCTCSLCTTLRLFHIHSQMSHKKFTIATCVALFVNVRKATLKLLSTKSKQWGSETHSSDTDVVPFQMWTTHLLSTWFSYRHVNRAVLTQPRSNHTCLTSGCSFSWTHFAQIFSDTSLQDRCGTFHPKYLCTY